MIDIDAALHHLSRALPPAPVEGIPDADLARSPAAAAVSRLSAEAGLLAFHYEHRAALELPDHWLAPGADPELPQWVDGVLPEPKYQAFRHDLPIASFHPGHRAKWGTHELCHALVGFAWAPGASPLFHATAARLAELLPVALYYFLDEVGLSRCERHQGPLFRGFCAACERIAARGRGPFDEDRAVAWLRDTARYLDAELAAIARTRRLGVPCSHVWGSLDLCTDGLAYAAGHGPRLGSASMARWGAWFVRDGDPVAHPTVEALEARVIAVARALAEGTAVAPAAADPATGRARWVAMDLSARLLQVWEDTDGEVADALLALAERAATGDVGSVFDGYVALFEDYELPAPDEVFAVGYDLPGVPSRSAPQLAEGLRSVVPLVAELAEDAGVDLAAAFAAEDPPVRAPLGERFAGFLERRHPGVVAGLARYEASLRAATADGEALVLGPDGEGWRLAEGARVLRLPFEPVSLAESVESGEVTGVADGDGLTLDPEPELSPTVLVIGRDRAGELVLADVPWEEGPALEAPEGLSAQTRETLAAMGLVVRRRWP